MNKKTRGNIFFVLKITEMASNLLTILQFILSIWFWIRLIQYFFNYLKSKIAYKSDDISKSDVKFQNGDSNVLPKNPKILLIWVENVARSFFECHWWRIRASNFRNSISKKSNLKIFMINLSVLNRLNCIL